MTVLTGITYAGAAMLAKLSYPEPGAEMSLLGAPGDVGDTLPGHDYPAARDLRPACASLRILSAGKPAWQCASRITFKNDLTSPAAAAHGQFYRYDRLGQVQSAAIGQVNPARTAVGGIPKSAESFTYYPQGNCRRKADLRHRSTAFRHSAITFASKQWNNYHQSLHGTPEIHQARTHDRDNQLTQIDGSSSGLSYDAAGQMIKLPTTPDLTGPPRTLKWNAWGYITEVKNSIGTPIQTNQYDALGRRVTTGDGTTTSHLYYDDQWRVVEQREDASTDRERQYVWHPADRYTLILRDRDTDGNGTLDERLYLLKQHLDPAAVIDATGAVQERYQFTAFGRPAFLAPDYSGRASSNFAWDVLFHVELTDPETGWMNYGYRSYAPELGRWLSRDPIGEEGGANLYGMVGNDGVNRFDFLGNQADGLVALYDAVHANGVKAHKETEQEYLKQIQSDTPHVLVPGRHDNKPFVPRSPKEYGGRVCEKCVTGDAGADEISYYFTQTEGPWPSRDRIVEVHVHRNTDCEPGDRTAAFWHTHPSALRERRITERIDRKKVESFQYDWSSGGSFSDPDIDFVDRRDLRNPEGLPVFVTYRKGASERGWKYHTDVYPPRPRGNTVRMSEEQPVELLRNADGSRWPQY